MLALDLTYAADPLPLFAKLANRTQPVLLHSADRSNRFGRFDILSCDPATTVSWQHGEFRHDAISQPSDDPLSALQELCAARELGLAAEHDPALPPFRTGFLGYLGYGLHQSLEDHGAPPASPDSLPPLWGGIYEWSIVTDHARRRTTLYSEAWEHQHHAQHLLEAPDAPLARGRYGKFALSGGDYDHGFERIMNYLLAGDCYQVNYAQHYRSDFAGDAFDLYRQWCQRQPAPFSAYLGLDQQRAVLSFSPERFLRKRGSQVQTCPIKGTRPRRRDPSADHEERQRLLDSTKDRAENLMIVDLLRNDLGKICEPGTIRVPRLFEAIAFRNVHHLVSTIGRPRTSGHRCVEHRA